MLNIYVDEKYEYDNQKIILSCIGIVENQLVNINEDVLKLKSPFNSKKDNLKHLFEKYSSLSVLGYSNFNKNFFNKNIVDFSNDIQKMKRLNNIWSQMVTYSTAFLVRIFLDKSVLFSTVNIFYHQKSLTSDHRIGFHDSIKKESMKIANEYIKERRLNNGTLVKVGNIKQIFKPKNKNPDRGQLGIGIADHICTHYNKYIKLDNSYVFSLDLSSIISDTLKRFDDLERQ